MLRTTLRGSKPKLRGCSGRLRLYAETSAEMSSHSLKSAGYWVCWGAAVLMLGIAAYLVLPACGVSVFGHSVSWCPGGADTQYAQLETKLRILERQAIAKLLCRPESGHSIAGERAAAGSDPGPGSLPPADGNSELAPGPGSAAGQPPAGPAAPQAPGSAGPQAPAQPAETGTNGREPSGEGTMTGPGPQAVGPTGGAGSTGAGSSAVNEGGDNGAGSPGADPTGLAPSSLQPAEAPSGDGPAASPPAAPSPPPPDPTSSDGSTEAAAPNASAGPGATQTDADCSGTAQATRRVSDLLLVLDHSKSMGLPADANAAELEGLEHIIETGSASEVMKANRRYNQLIAGAQTSRLDELKSSVQAVIESDRTDRNWGLVTFAGCSGVRDKGVFSKTERSTLVELVQGLSTRPATPLAQALESALRQSSASQGNAAVVLVTDGRDTCNGDPCAIAAASGQQVPVHVVTVGHATQHACISESTGGDLFTSEHGADLRQVLTRAIRTATQEDCQ